VILGLAFAHAMLVPGTTEVTVYNQGLGFIKDVRTLQLKSGLQNVVVEDVAQLIDATSVGFKCLNNPGSVSVLEQNYQYDLISPQAILEKSVGKRIRLTRAIANKKETLEGVLLNSPTSVVSKDGGHEYSYDGLVIRADDGRIILSPEGEIDVLSIPEGLISRPSLVWQLESTSDQDVKMELSYLTKGMSWTANYVLTLDENKSGDIQGWATINNQSGMSFADAKLKLLAGEVNVMPAESKSSSNLKWSKPRFADHGGLSLPFTEQSLFEYHLYTLERPASVRNKETKQLSLLEGSDVPVKKVIAFEGSAEVSEAGQGTEELDSAVKVKFRNDEKSHLGMPMPAGKVRLYQRDAGGSLQFLGEDEIKHTPRDEKLSLTVGKSFDMKATHKQVSFTKTGKRSSVSTYEIEVRNRKKTADTATIYERIGGQWKISSNTDSFVKEDASTAVFEVKLKAGEVKKLKFTVEAKW
jgi:hypothetical protein